MSLTKHQKNALKKRRKLANKGHLRCPRCGGATARQCCGDPLVRLEEVKPSVLQKLSEEARLRRSRWVPPHHPNSTASSGKPKSIKIPEFVQNLALRSSRAAEVSIDDLTYVGRSNVFSTKAGKRSKIETHRFQIDQEVDEEIEACIDPIGEVVNLWHGTPLSNTGSILIKGLRKSVNGMLGPGVYLGTKQKAIHYARRTRDDWGLMILCEAKLGKVLTVRDTDAAPKKTRSYDTIHCARGRYKWAWGGRVRQDEWCIRDPVRVTLKELHLIPRDA